MKTIDASVFAELLEREVASVKRSLFYLENALGMIHTLGSQAVELQRTIDAVKEENAKLSSELSKAMNGMADIET